MLYRYIIILNLIMWLFVDLNKNRFVIHSFPFFLRFLVYFGAVYVIYSVVGFGLQRDVCQDNGKTFLIILFGILLVPLAFVLPMVWISMLFQWIKKKYQFQL